MATVLHRVTNPGDPHAELALSLRSPECYRLSTMAGRISRILGTGFLFLTIFPALAAAGGARLSRFPTGAVHPGDAVELAWTCPASGVEELEIVLSVDGGQRYTIRVSPELD